jgi:hypothetical protein
MIPPEPDASPVHPRGRAARVRDAALAPYRRRGALTCFVYALEIPAAFVLSQALAMGVSPHAVFRSLIIAAGAAIVLMVLFSALLRDVHRAGIAVVLIYLLGLSVGTGIMFVFFIPAAVLVVALDRLPVRRVGWDRVSGGLATFMSILLVVILVQGSLNGRLPTLADLTQGGGLSSGEPSHSGGGTQPDIYVIVVDGYARPDTLESSFGFDDEPFLDQLRSRGFDVATDNHSNYPLTGPTFVTMLNMGYLEQIPQVANLHSGDPSVDGQYRGAINKNRVFELLRGRGYQIVSTGSEWEQLAIRESDVFLDGGQVNTFEASLLRQTGLAALIGTVAPSWGADQARSRIDAAFEELRQIAQTGPRNQPQLVISHVLAPHPPFVYGANGEDLPLDLSQEYLFNWSANASDPLSRAQYAGQVAYVNEQLLPTIDSIIAGSTRPPVVVLMSDHGSRLDSPAGATMMSPEADRNFFATLTPGHQGLFGAGPTPVNLFPHLLDAYLGFDLPIQADRRYISSWSRPMEFTLLPSDTP